MHCISIKDITLIIHAYKKTTYGIIESKYISSIHKINPLSRCLLNAFIHRIINPLIRFTHPIGYTLLILLDDINRPIRATPIDDDILDIRIRLINNREDGFFYMLYVIEDDGHYGD